MEKHNVFLTQLTLCIFCEPREQIDFKALFYSLSGRSLPVCTTALKKLKADGGPHAYRLYVQYLLYDKILSNWIR